MGKRKRGNILALFRQSATLFSLPLFFDFRMILLDGKATADHWITSLSDDIRILAPLLAVVLVGENPASISYVRKKRELCEKYGVAYRQIDFPDTATEEEVLTTIETLNHDAAVSGFIVQLPLPEHISVARVIRAIDPHKDVDGFGAYNLGKTFLGTEYEHLPPATPKGIVRLLEEYNIAVDGKEVVVVGQSNIVGKPISVMLLNRHATVTTCNRHTTDLKSHTLRADVLIVAVGKPNLITADMVKEGVVIVDVGTNRLESGKLVGDCDFEAISQKAAAMSPVPGGVGPMTVAALVANTVEAAKRHKIRAERPREHQFWTIE